MKKLILIAIILITNSVIAQINLTPTPIEDLIICSTSSISSKLVHLEQIKGLDHTNDKYFIKLYVHVLRKESAPFEGQSNELINKMMQTLYDDFDPLGIHFVWDGNVDNIHNDTFFGAPRVYTGQIFNTNNHQDGIDIYLSDDFKQLAASANGIGESTELIYGGYWFEDQLLPLSRLKVISHEMGHVLYLWHTHHGTFSNDNGSDSNACSELVNPVTDPSNPLYEEQQANRTLCGDYIADTPADPNMFTLNANRYTCEYEPIYNLEYFDLEDANGDEYQPDTSNLMSYTYPTCMDTFTFGQKKRMKNAIWYLDNLHDTLLEDYTYIRPEANCFVCENVPKTFKIYSSSGVVPTINSSANITTEITEQTNEYVKIEVINLLDSSEEGQSGYFEVLENGNIVARQDIWVGKPQTVPANTLSGTETVNQDDGVFHSIENRLNGILTYGWDLPEPNQTVDFLPEQPNTEIWRHFAFDKYFKFTNGKAGNQTGYVRGYGVNPCGEGSSGDENELCVENEDDPEGDNCDNTANQPILYYPNPSDSLLEIDLSMQDYKVFTILIYDQLQTQKYYGQTTNVIKTVDMFNLPNGLYYLHIYDDNNTEVLNRILMINH